MWFNTGSWLPSSRKGNGSENESPHGTKSHSPSFDDKSQLSKPFWRYYIDDYVNSLSPKPRERSRESIIVRLLFTFGKSKEQEMQGSLTLFNTSQLKAIFDYYGNIADHASLPRASSYFGNLSDEVSYRNRIQHRIDEKLNKLIVAKGFVFSSNLDRNPLYNYLTLNLNYSKLNRIDTAFAMRHLELMMMTYKTWSLDIKDNLEIDLFVFSVRDRFLPLSGFNESSDKHVEECDATGKDTHSSLDKRGAPRYFWEYYVDNYIDRISGRSIDESRESLVITLQFGIKGSMDTPFTYTLSNTLLIKNSDQMRAVFNHYSLSVNEFRAPMTMSYVDCKDLSREINRRNRKQEVIDRMLIDEVLTDIPAENFWSYEEKDKGTRIFRLNYDGITSSKLNALRRHIALMMEVFRNWNDDSKDIGEVNRFLRSVESDFLSINARVNGEDNSNYPMSRDPLLASLPLGARENDENDGKEEDDDDDNDQNRDLKGNDIPDDHFSDTTDLSPINPLSTDIKDTHHVSCGINENPNPDIPVLTVDTFANVPMIYPDRTDIPVPGNLEEISDSLPNLPSPHDENISMMEDVD